MHTLGKMVSPMEKTQSPAERFYESIYYSDESTEEDYLAELAISAATTGTLHCVPPVCLRR